MKDKKTAWEIFLQKGTIKSYLNYKKAEQKEDEYDLFHQKK